MQIDHTLTIQAPVAHVWPIVQRPEMVVESLPGVTLTELDGEEFSGAMAVGLGPMRLTYSGSGTLRYDDSARTIHIDARGNETRGAGSAAAVVDVSVHDGAEGSTRLDISIDLDLQGKPAQFGRGILSEVVTRLAAQFGRNLERQVLDVKEEQPTAQPATPTSPGASERTPASAIAATQSISGPNPWRSPLLGVAVGAAVGAAIASLLGRRRPIVSLTIIGTDDAAWLELARTITGR